MWNRLRSWSRGRQLIVGCAALFVFGCCGMTMLGVMLDALGIIPDPTPEPERVEVMATTPALADAATSADTAVPTNTPLPTDISTLAPTVTPEPTDTPIPTTTPEPTNSPTPTATPDPNLIRTGTHLVGEDIQAGIYLGQAGLDFFRLMLLGAR